MKRTSRKAKPQKAKPDLKIATATPAGAGLGNIRDSIDAIDARIHALTIVIIFSYTICTRSSCFLIVKYLRK